MGRNLIQRFFFRFGEKRKFHRLTIAVWILSKRKEKYLAFERIELAFGIIQQYAPEKLRALQNDLDSILVAGDPTYRGRYHHKLRMVELYHDYVVAKGTNT